ncbi:MAG: hydrolase [Amycolatopsis sp.]|uniref:alpha/beta hydrolase n=1 Tax=Amycolatopsis sp. TaxID=37632 RepID=UPI00262C9062|nr:alpha/beta hydrolase [Amycolatopsis sp.]MCU1686859.1 hydrolase [Amycolatopsis sp.]
MRTAEGNNPKPHSLGAQCRPRTRRLRGRLLLGEGHPATTGGGNECHRGAEPTHFPRRRCRHHHVALARQDGPTILVAHSYGGTVISQTGLDPKVAGLVYVAARAPDAGEDFAALSAKFPTPPITPGIITSGGFKLLSQPAFLQDFANGVPRKEALTLYAAQGLLSTAPPTTSIAAWHQKPSWYAVSKNDRTINPDLERFMAQRMNATTIEADSGHLSLVTHPDVIARLILEAAANR